MIESSLSLSLSLSISSCQRSQYENSGNNMHAGHVQRNYMLLVTYVYHVHAKCHVNVHLIDHV